MKNSNLEILLFEAAAQGNVNVVKHCVEHGVDLNSVNKKRQTALMVAAYEGQKSAISFLLEQGANVDKQDEVKANLLLYGAETGDLQLVQMAIEYGASIDCVTRFGSIALAPALIHLHTDIVKFLLAETFINVNHTNYCGWTPLFELIVRGDGSQVQARLVELLLENGADKSLADPYDNLPLTAAAQRGFQTIVDMLE